jgi:hypothetical protein
VQILEEVAFTQRRTLRAEVDKGYTTTIVGCVLGGPKPKFNYVLCVDYGLLVGTYFGQGRKGSRLIFRPRDGVFSGNACEVRDVRRSPGTSYLFVLTALRVSFGALFIHRVLTGQVLLENPLE